MNDFETHPIGTADMIKEMESMLDTYRSWHYNSRQRIAELEAERDDAVHCHKTSDEWRSHYQTENERLRKQRDRWINTCKSEHKLAERLRAALASTHFHHKTLIAGCPECEKSMPEELRVRTGGQ